ncbi:MAG: dTDP-4-dehydrorhamnose 3,5-epimerase [Candidatus Caldatribacterium sp.]|nr:dTDP-4-dehydrorhamnose 3,5-epimerase [Candidatus Caldatribacterium sp.]
MPFRFERLEIPEVILIEPQVFHDERGFFMETYRYSTFAAFGIKENFVQDNHSRSVRGVLRGLHYQNPPKAQGKLVRVVVGEIFDVAVDIRKGSPTYGRWVGVKLSAENRKMLYIPAGFAHGFCVLSDVAEVVYKVTEEYAPECEAGIIWNDPEIGITWPIENPIVSPKDARWPPLEKAVNRFTYSGGGGE